MRVLIFTLINILFLMLSGCSRTAPINTLDLHQLELLSTNTVKPAGGAVNKIRYSILRDTALSMGARSGLAWRSRQIDRLLASQSKMLDRAFNFNGLLLPHDVMPPVLTEGRDSLHLASGNAIRLADRTYKIVSQAHFVTAPPTWRDYIEMDYKKPSPPERSLLPKTPKETKIWQYYIRQGWQQGVQQANTIYTANLNRMQRDYRGMVLYRHLLAENMVSMPYVAHTNLGITNRNGELRVNDQILRITALPQLQANSKTWNPVFIKTWLGPRKKPKS